MARPNRITPDLTLRQVTTYFPAARRVLDRYPQARPNGRYRLQSLERFAAAMRVAPGRLVSEVAEAAGVSGDMAVTEWGGGIPSFMRDVAIALLLALTIGAGFGVWLLLRIAAGGTYAQAPAASVHVHGTAQLWGWMALFVFAIGMHLLRQNAKHPPPMWVDSIAPAAVVAGVLLLLIGMAAAVHDMLPAIDVAGSALLVLAALAYAVSSTWSIAGRGQRPLAWHRFVLASTGWLLAWAVCDLVLRIRYRSEPVLPDSARSLLIVLPVLGFATNAIFGYGVRLIPGLLNLRDLRQGAYPIALGAYNAGLLWFLLLPRFAAVGAGLMLLGVITYLYGLNFLRGRPAREIYGVDPRGGAFVSVAYFWLIAGLVMILIQSAMAHPPGHAYSGAWRHGLTVGFITTMILSVGHRMVPIFLRQPLASTRMMLAALVLISVGNAWRVIFELLTLGGWGWAFRIMGVSGVLEIAAITLFAVDLLLTLRQSRTRYRADEPITPATRVAEVMDVNPELEARLNELNIHMFDAAPFVAPSMTFGALALAEGWKPEELIGRLMRTLRAAPCSEGLAR